MERFSIPHQCHGITRRGSRCSISSRSSFAGADGRDLARPLRHGSDYCVLHLQTLVSAPCAVADALVVYLDFETSGLDIFTDHIVEAGLLSETGECFATVCCPPVLTPGPHVHGISDEELAVGPTFIQMIQRMIDFLNGLLLTSVPLDDSSDDEISQLRFSDPELVLVAHNGLKFDFPFLLSECFRNGLSLAEIASWRFVDTLDVVRAIDQELYGSCQKLQCLLHCADIRELNAHRALDN